MHINCETHSYKAAQVKYEPATYDKCDSCGAMHPEGENIVYNELMGMRLCESCWESLQWH